MSLLQLSYLSTKPNISSNPQKVVTEHIHRRLSQIISSRAPSKTQNGFPFPGPFSQRDLCEAMSKEYLNWDPERIVRKFEAGLSYGDIVKLGEDLYDRSKKIGGVCSSSVQ
jgi:hypothetical protein